MSGEPVIRLLAQWMFDFAIHSTVVLGGLALLARKGWPASPAFRDVAWKTAVVAVVASSALAAWSPGPTSVSDHGAVLERTLLVRDGTSPPVRTSERIAISGRVADLGRCLTAAGNGAVQSSGRIREVRRACGRSADSVPALLAVLWLVVACGLGLRLARNAWALREELAGARVPGGTAAGELLDRILARAGREDSVELVVVPALASPAVLGLRRIGLPPAALDEMPPEELETVLAHEAAHVVRRDPLWVAILACVEALFWFQPLLAKARREIRDAAELLADDRAVEWTGRPLDLARSLARVGGWLERGGRVPRLAVLRRGDGVLTRRVRRLVTTPSRPARLPRLPRLLTPVLTVLLCLLGAALPRIHLPPAVRIDMTVTILPPEPTGRR